MPRLYIVTGAPGAGKSSLLPHLAAYPFGTVDFDELLEHDGSLLDINITSPAANSMWPAYNRLWVKIAVMMLRAGGDVLILCPLTPAEWASASAEISNPPPASWAHLDCADEDRRTRLAARGWMPDQIEEALKDAEELRSAVSREFTTTGRSPTETATALGLWVCGDTE
ncbi:AAA family ATPase [Streptomyces sp. ITFR-6]|uniref:AAA family ATPase n=1 Tax=Streptomyces sp. ITFR-6 TaxID=3075197 RepID=UPI00288A134F|nr:AAA family ATPase [Streptomyces sp. ITFR-6]WNI27659.1 AAA family ATPase [Streptomyces sp. ITFR-6]